MIVNLEWANRSNEAIELMPVVTVRVGAEGQQAPRVEAEETDSINIKPGEPADYDAGFLVSGGDASGWSSRSSTPRTHSVVSR